MKDAWLGTYTRKTPCKKCGGTEFRHVNMDCVQCNRDRRAKAAEKRGHDAAAEPDNAGRRRGRKMAEAAADRTLMNDILSRKW